MNLYWGGAASFAFFMLLGVLGGKLFHFEGPTWYFFMGIMAALGLGSFAIFAYFQNRLAARREAAANSGSPASTTAGGNAEVEHLIREANARLAQSRGGVSIANLPLIFVAGDRGTAKTSTILNSGLEPELLAGQIYQESVVASTRAANIFFARDTVFVEAGGALMAQPGNWKALVAKLQPARLKSVGGKGTQAPRGVLLCFDLEAFTRPGAADAIGNASRYLHERLGEISQLLGISFPVYVLFTRADRLPFFAEFVRNLTADEAGQVVGATLPIRPHASGGVYAEEETRRLNDACNLLFHSFCDHRLHLLPRESDAERIPAAYEFPREFRKLRNLLVQFLVDIARPSQLRASPFLRGFYFSGVRPVEVRDVAATPQAQPAHEPSGATGMFRAGLQAERRAQQAQAGPTAGARKLPQWLFLGHLFHDVILADAPSRAASGSSVKTSLTKRILLATAAALCLIYSIMLTVSYFGNSSLASEAAVASKAITAQSAAPGLPSEDSLTRLETLRKSLAKLTDYDLHGAPLSLRWGLYRSDLLPNVRRIYYARFRQLLFGSTQAQMLAYLNSRPAQPTPTDDYSYPYDTLKAYLLTTSEWKRDSDPGLQSFLGSRLLNRWSNNRDAEIGQSRMDLAKLQFDFYAKDLANGNPYSIPVDTPARDRARLYLSGFTGIERAYRALLADAARNHPAVTFNQKFPGTADALTSTVEVSWAFTRDGWKFVQDAIKKQNFGGEQWVLGPAQAQSLDPATLEKGILDRYTADYIDQWRNVLKKSNVTRYANFVDASKKLTLLTGSGAPLLALFWWTSQNTAIDLPGVSDKFRAVQVVSPYAAIQQYVLPPNQNYNQGLMTLQQAVDRAANKEPNSDQAVRDNALSATNSTRQLSTTFPPDPEASIDHRSEDLLIQPIKNLDTLGSQDLNSGGSGLCSAFNSKLKNQFPFNPTAKSEVSLDDLGNILRPKTGMLWTVYESTLKNAMDCTADGTCTPKPNSKINPNFVSSISQLMKFSRALYGDSGTDPNLQYTLKPQASDLVQEFTVTINGQSATLKGGAQRTFSWPGTGQRSFRLALKIGGTSFDVEPFDGPWSVFRFFADANNFRASAGSYTFDWAATSGLAAQPMKVDNRPVTYEFVTDTGVFSKDFLSKLNCALPVAR